MLIRNLQIIKDWFKKKPLLRIQNIINLYDTNKMIKMFWKQVFR